MLKQFAGAAIVMAFVLGPAGTAGAGLTGYWPLNETSGTVVDDLQQDDEDAAVAGDLTGSWWVSGKFDNGLECKPSPLRRLLTNRSASELNIDGSKPRTLSMWAYIDGYSADFTIASCGSSTSGNHRWGFTWDDGPNQYRILTDSSGIYHVGSGSHAGSWHHFALTYAGGSARTQLYIDGNYVGQTPSDQTLDTYDNSLWYSANGDIDDCAIYDEDVGAARVGLIHALGDEPDLQYDLGLVDQLFQKYDASQGVVLAGRLWTPFGTGEGYSGGGGDLIEYDTANDQFAAFFGTNTGMYSTEIQPVPEPAGLGLFCLVALGLRKRRS
jgi:hypothetical protein